MRDTTDMATTMYQNRYPNFVSKVFISNIVFVFRPVKLIKSSLGQSTILLVA